jgi:hypothetical protein
VYLSKYLRRNLSECDSNCAAGMDFQARVLTFGDYSVFIVPLGKSRPIALRCTEISVPEAISRVT